MIASSVVDTFQPIGAHYLVRFVEPETHSPGGIAIPDTARPETQSAVVLAHGPGQLLPGGGWAAMQCGVGDFVVAKANHFDRLEHEEAFVHDQDLVAFRPWDGEAHGGFRAAGDYLLVVPDAAKRVDAETGATVQTGGGTVLVACAAVAGGELRENARGDELVRELERLSQSQKYREQPSEYYRHQVLHDYMDALADWEIRALGAALKRKGDTNWRAHLPRRPRVRAKAGRVIDAGRQSPVRLDAGARVHFDKDLQAVALVSDEGSLWAVRSQWIAAVETDN